MLIKQKLLYLINGTILYVLLAFLTTCSKYRLSCFNNFLLTHKICRFPLV
jgi:hypothetical protein